MCFNAARDELIPRVAALFGFLLARERLGLAEAICFGPMLAGMVVAQIDRQGPA